MQLLFTWVEIELINLSLFIPASVQLTLIENFQDQDRKEDCNTAESGLLILLFYQNISGDGSL